MVHKGGVEAMTATDKTGINADRQYRRRGRPRVGLIVGTRQERGMSSGHGPGDALEGACRVVRRLSEGNGVRRG